jgi:uncharacterized protein YndB with AHSA1/START domain
MAVTGKAKPNELYIERLYDAPVKAVWDAWTDPEQAALWWGPRGFTITTHGKDLRPGGIWHYTMHGPDGTDYPNKALYHEVVEHQKLVYDHGGNDERAPLFRVTVFFKEVKGKTLLCMTMALPTPEAAAETRAFIKKAGGEGTWDRLAEYLEKQASGKEKFFINRTFDAPLDVMFDMWTDPKHFAQWLAPTGFTMTFHEADIRPGGRSFYSMASDNGKMKMHGRAEYLKIEKPRLLVYKQQFCDEKGGVSRHPGAPVWPETMLTTVRLTEEEPGRTRVTVMWEPCDTFSAAELAAFIAQRGGMTQGWTGSFDKLEAYISRSGQEPREAFQS